MHNCHWDIRDKFVVGVKVRKHCIHDSHRDIIGAFTAGLQVRITFVHNPYWFIRYESIARGKAMALFVCYDSCWDNIGEFMPRVKARPSFLNLM